MQGAVGQSRLAVADDRLALARLRDMLTALPEPWTVLASRRRSGADGPPWVRYLALHPAKGIALVDVDPTELAVAPLEDFFEHTGLAALRSGGLPIVAVTLSMDGATTVVESIEAAFVGSSCELVNPNWCEAIIELLLTTPALCLTRLRRKVPPSPSPIAPDTRSAPPGGVGGSSASVTLARSAIPPAPNNQLARPVSCDPLAMPEDWPPDPDVLPPSRTWRSWPISPVAALASLLAVAAILLVSYPTWSPTPKTANNSVPRLAAAAVPPTADPTTPLVMATALPARAANRAQPTTSSTASAAPTTTPARPTPRPFPDRHGWWSAQRSSSAPTEPRMAVASTRTAPHVACADLLHPDRPGGWNYSGPSVPGCLPIRFFGLIGMR
jgi:hypothetical protein